MDFDIRAISLAPSVAFDARTPVAELLGNVVEFRSGITIAMTLPAEPALFDRLLEPERLLPALTSWARVYDYPRGQDRAMYILAPAENAALDGEPLFYRLDFFQPARVKPGPRPPVDILDGAVMTYDECVQWLADLSFEERGSKGTILQRPRALKTPVVRIAWVGPERLDGEYMPDRLQAIGKVVGAEMVHIGPVSFAHAKARLAGVSPLDAIVLCVGSASYITGSVAPKDFPAQAVHHSTATTLAQVYADVTAAAQDARVSIEEARKEGDDDDLLRLMLQGMLSHSKIGPFNHCTKDTVLTRVRARRLNVPAAEVLLDEHSEGHHDTKTSEKLFLWKDHHDGRQYFLNVKKIEHIKILITGA